jgi:hypothetical protein
MAAIPSNSVFLAVAWTLGKRYPVLLGLLALVCLALFNGAAIDTLSLPADPPPAWLPALSVVVFLALPGLVVANVAALASTGRGCFPFGADARVSWKPVMGRLALAVLLVVYFAYTLVWVGIWDGTDDGVGALILMMVSFLAAIAAGMVIGMTSTGWRRWLGLVSPVLIVAGVSWASFSLGNNFSIQAVTETRAARIQAAVERFRAETGRYPVELGELIPRELWWIPKPMIFRGEEWCYQGGSDYYRLGAVYREHWSSPLLSVRVYAAAGNPPGSWTCDEIRRAKCSLRCVGLLRRGSYTRPSPNQCHLRPTHPRLTHPSRSVYFCRQLVAARRVSGVCCAGILRGSNCDRPVFSQGRNG